MARFILAATLDPPTASTVQPLSCALTRRLLRVERSIWMRRNMRSRTGYRQSKQPARLDRSGERIRRENPAFQTNHNLRFHEVDNDQIIAYSRAAKTAQTRCWWRSIWTPTTSSLGLSCYLWKRWALIQTSPTRRMTADRCALSLAWQAKLCRAKPSDRACAHLRDPAQSAHEHDFDYYL